MDKQGRGAVERVTVRKVMRTEMRPMKMVMKSWSSSSGLRYTFLSGKIISRSANGTSWNLLRWMLRFNSSCKVTCSQPKRSHPSLGNKGIQRIYVYTMMPFFVLPHVFSRPCRPCLHTSVSNSHVSKAFMSVQAVWVFVPFHF